MVELKPCPFCGESAEIIEPCDEWKYYRVEHYCMIHNNIYKIFMMTNWCDTEDQAAELWNSRKESSQNEICLPYM